MQQTELCIFYIINVLDQDKWAFWLVEKVSSMIGQQKIHQRNVSKVLMFYMGFIKLVKYRMSIIFMTPNVKEDIVMSPWQKWHKISKWRKLCGCWEYIPSHIMTPRNGFLSQGHKDHPKVCMDTTACQRNKTCSADTMDCKDCMGMVARESTVCFRKSKSVLNFFMRLVRLYTILFAFSLLLFTHYLLIIPIELCGWFLADHSGTWRRNFKHPPVTICYLGGLR